METLYDLLGALPNDDADSLRAAFRRAAKGAIQTSIRETRTPGSTSAGSCVPTRFSAMSSSEQLTIVPRAIYPVHRGSAPWAERTSASGQSASGKLGH